MFKMVGSVSVVIGVKTGNVDGAGKDAGDYAGDDHLRIGGWDGVGDADVYQ